MTGEAPSNVVIAGALEELADLLEIEQENPFKVRAYRTAAAGLIGHPEPLADLLARGGVEELTRLPGVGKEIARKIEALLSSGELPQLVAARLRVPRGLLQVMRLPGVGPKRAQRLWLELGVRDLADLGEAARRGAVAQLSGFGDKSQQKILAGLQVLAERGQWLKLVQADRLMAPLLSWLRQAPGVSRVEPAGSVRRRRETVRDLDLQALADPAAPVLARLLAYPGVQVLQQGPDRATVALPGGDVQVDLRVAPAASFGAAWLHLTGSRAHEQRLRERAAALNLVLTGEGLRPAAGPADAPAQAGQSEEALYAALGLPFIPPELREDLGEVQAAAAGRLPRLVEVGDLRGDLQMHSTWSDGKQTVVELAQACLARGYEYFAVTDHSRALAMVNGLDGRRVREQRAQIAEAQATVPGIRILRALEVDILADGTLDLEQEALDELELVLVSVHSRFELPQAEQTARVLRALAHPRVSILAHPTGRLLLRREPLQLDLEAIFAAAAAHGVAVECNAHPDRLDLNDALLRRARAHGCRVVVSTDAHRVEELALIGHGIDQARRAGLQAQDVLNTLPLAELRAALGARCRIA